MQGDDGIRLVNGRAWAEFCDRLKATGQRILDPAFPSSARERAHGFRLLSRLTIVGLEWNLFFADPEFPAFYRMTDDRPVFGATNADNLYLYARVSGDRDYRITGNCRGKDFVIESLSIDMSSFAGIQVTGLSSEECKIESDGSFEVVLSRKEHPGNWLRLQPEAKVVLLREYWQDWETDESGEYRIESVDGSSFPRILSSAGLERAIDEAAAWIERALDTWGSFSAKWPLSADSDNVVPAPERAEEFSVYLRYGIGFWSLAPDESLVIEFEPPRARYYSLQLYNLWTEQLDWSNRMTSLNDRQVRVDPDGLCRIVIAHTDPETPNWLDTEGLPRGMVMFRAVWLSSPAARPVSRVVKFNDVRKHLPGDTPRVTAADRQAAIARRRAHLARRFRT